MLMYLMFERKEFGKKMIRCHFFPKKEIVGVLNPFISQNSVNPSLETHVHIIQQTLFFAVILVLYHQYGKIMRFFHFFKFRFMINLLKKIVEVLNPFISQNSVNPSLETRVHLIM